MKKAKRQSRKDEKKVYVYEKGKKVLQVKKEKKANESKKDAK